ncbi:hypothetical protein [Stenotrophomonas sp. PS02297]|uniref:hypothetical protein n=1 Tax=Stenotrophomonas sp. PS02297 TaxID=2991423 RepID=UPI00249AC835|nr:hypothetical protein [Stenotrophomonas sp. PS02297]
MAKPTYLVTVVYRGKEALFRDFLKQERHQRQSGVETILPAEELAFIEPVRASNRHEALVLARALHPGHDIAPRIVKRAARPGRG